MRVFVLSHSGKPLMPTTPRRARIFLKTRRARVVTCEPFTIQLRFETTTHTQPVTVGVDTGSQTVGIAATANMEVVLQVEIRLRTDISGKLIRRRQYRRTRRSRKTRYRGPPIVAEPLVGFLPRCAQAPTPPSKRCVLSAGSCPLVRSTWKLAALIPRKCRTRRSPVFPTSRANFRAICCASICLLSGRGSVPIVTRVEFHYRWSISSPRHEEAVIAPATS